MMKRRTFISGSAAAFLAACAAPPLVDRSVSQDWYVLRVSVDTSALSGVSGRALTVAPSKVADDVDQAVTRQLAAASGRGNRSVDVEISLSSVQLVSPGQSLLIGGTSAINGIVRVVDSNTGAILLDDKKLVGTAKGGYGAGGLIGALSTRKAEDDYKATVLGFATDARNALFGPNN